MTGSRSRTSCKPLSQRFELLTLSTQYIQNLEIIRIILQFTVLMQEINYLHEPSTALTMYRKGAYNDKGKIFNKLPKCITELALRKTKLHHI